MPRLILLFLQYHTSVQYRVVIISPPTEDVSTDDSDWHLSGVTAYGVWSDGTRVIVADYDSSKVYLWNSWPSGEVSTDSADVVLGSVPGTAQDRSQVHAV